MKSDFNHQHAVDYLCAWNKLADACTFRAQAEQIKIIEAAKTSVNVGRECRGGKGAGFTDTEMAMIAACDNHLAMRTGEPFNHEVVTIFDDESMSEKERANLMKWFDDHSFFGR